MNRDVTFEGHDFTQEDSQTEYNIPEDDVRDPSVGSVELPVELPVDHDLMEMTVAPYMRKFQ